MERLPRCSCARAGARLRWTQGAAASRVEKRCKAAVRLCFQVEAVCEPLHPFRQFSANGQTVEFGQPLFLVKP